MQSTLLSPTCPFFPNLRSPSHSPSFSVPASVAVDSPSSTTNLSKYSSRSRSQRGASQAMLYDVGLFDDDMAKPQVKVSLVWYEDNICNMNLLSLSEANKKGVAATFSFRRDILIPQILCIVLSLSPSLFLNPKQFIVDYQWKW